MKPTSSEAKLFLATVSVSAIGEAEEKTVSPSDDTSTPEEREYIRELRVAVINLDTYLVNGPGFAKETVPAKYLDKEGKQVSPEWQKWAKRQRDWLNGYARPLKAAGVEQIDLQATAERFLSRGGDVKYFPTPPQFIDFASAVRKDRLIRDAPPLPARVEKPKATRAEWVGRSNETRKKYGLPLLPEE